MFENCTRPGEIIYSSDRVAIRFFGSGFLTKGLTFLPQQACEFRLIPSVGGLVAAGSDDGKFAIYSIDANRYLIWIPQVVWPGPPQQAPLGLQLQQTVTGHPPSNVAAHADFVPIELFFSNGTVGATPVQTVYLTIQNVGNVSSSSSKGVGPMQVKVGGEEQDYLVISPVAPGSILRQPLHHLNRLLNDCEQVLVELDTNPDLKFQVQGDGAFSNADVFANDRKTLFARRLGDGRLDGRGAAGEALVPLPPCGQDPPVLQPRPGFVWIPATATVPGHWERERAN
jgi:hypothetical protein